MFHAGPRLRRNSMTRDILDNLTASMLHRMKMVKTSMIFWSFFGVMSLKVNKFHVGRSLASLFTRKFQYEAAAAQIERNAASVS